ncbi:MAG: hypothetical protein WC975_01560 [Phycisphaerae bacterium]
MEISKNTLNASQHPGNHSGGNGAHYSVQLLEKARADTDILTSVIIVAVGAWLTISPLAKTLGFVSLPPLYWLFLAIMLLGYAILTQGVKIWFIRRFGE